MDHPTENYDAVFFNLSTYLDPRARQALGLVSRSSTALQPVLQRDNSFWKKRFEELIGVELPSNQLPGMTPWLWKVKTLETDNVKGLLLSPELLDIKIGHSMMTDEGIHLDGWEKKEIANYALATGDEGIIRYLASLSVFDLDLYAEEALGTGIEHQEPGEERGISYYDDIPLRVAALLLDLFYGSEPDIKEIVLQSIEFQRLPIIAFFLNDPRANLTLFGEEYLEMAWSHNRDDIFYYLLDLPNVVITAGLIGDIWDEDNEEAMQKLWNHPKTAALMGTR